MKKFYLILVLTGFISFSHAQDIQLHYDLGEGRKYFTSTVEMFRTDNMGSTFFFIDMDYNVGTLKGVSLAYWEITRGLKFWDNPFELHFEYNGGMGRNSDGSSFGINNAWLFGGNYTWNTSDFSKIFTLQGMYKYIQGKNNVSFQITGVWTLQFLKNKITLTGFADFWREDNNFFLNASPGTKTKFVFLSEPQFWYNFTKNFSVGSEVEVASNLALHKGVKICPTIAAKWTF